MYIYIYVTWFPFSHNNSCRRLPEHIYLYTYIYIYICIHIDTYIHTCHIYTHIHVAIHTYTYTHTYIYIYTHVIHLSLSLYIYIYIYIYRLGNVLAFLFYGFHRRDSRGPEAAGNHTTTNDGNYKTNVPCYSGNHKTNNDGNHKTKRSLSRRKPYNKPSAYYEQGGHGQVTDPAACCLAACLPACLFVNWK